jgi:hypothetical protein
MPHIVITRGAVGLNADTSDLGDRVKSQEEKNREFLDAKERARRMIAPTRVLTPEDTRGPEVPHQEGHKCADCGFTAATAQGLSAHRRYQHSPKPAAPAEVVTE